MANRARALFAALILLGSVIAPGCRRPSSFDPGAASAAIGGAAEASFVAPPAILAASAAGADTVALFGDAAAGSEVELTAPDGQRFTTRADARGRWRLHLPAADRPRMFAVASLSQGRSVHAEGALVLTPNVRTPALVVRAGYAALPIGAGPEPDIVAVDYDPAGFAAIAGIAEPRTQVRLLVDGVAAGVGQTDAAGRYGLLAANRRLALGAHTLEVSSPAGPVRRSVAITTPTPLASPYAASGQPGAWRVEWALNGGGVQTTLVTAAVGG